MNWRKSWVATNPSPARSSRNEDNLWIAKSQTAVAVIDGMGGYRRKTVDGEVGGEHASSLAVEVLSEYLNEWDIFVLSLILINWRKTLHPKTIVTFFGIAGLSLLGVEGSLLEPVDARFALPSRVVARLGL